LNTGVNHIIISQGQFLSLCDIYTLKIHKYIAHIAEFTKMKNESQLIHSSIVNPSLIIHKNAKYCLIFFSTIVGEKAKSID
jgi:hypothetical protein